MKKTISLIISTVITLTLIPTFFMTGFAELFTENGIKFKNDKGIITVYGVEEGVTDLVIPEYVGENQVQNINLTEEPNIQSITIPASVITIRIEKCTNLTDFYVDDANEDYCAVDGVLYSKDMKTLICYPPARTETTFTVPDCVEKIGKSVDYENTGFSYAVNLKEIILPEGLIEIGDCAFVYCTFETIKLPKNLVSIGVDAFALNVNLKEITIPENVEDIYLPFYGCNNLETLIILDHTLEPCAFAPNPNDWVDVQYSYIFMDNDYDLSDVTTIYVPDNKLDIYIEEFPENYTVLPLSEIPKVVIAGDVNYDQTISISDIIMLQKGLANYDCVKMWKAGDMDGNEDVNIFDLIIMKREIINSLS